MLSNLPSNLSGKRILDAGCGTGQFSIELALRGANVLGIDIVGSTNDVDVIQSSNYLPLISQNLIKHYDCSQYINVIITFLFKSWSAETNLTVLVFDLITTE